VVDESLCYLSEVFGLIEPDPAAFSKGTWSEMFCHLAAQFAHAIILVDMTVPGLPITFCNNAFLNLTGYQMEDVVGQNCRFLQCDKTEPKVLSSLIAAVRSGMPFSGQITNAKRGGVVFENNLSLHPVYDSNGLYRFNIGVLADVAIVGSSQGTGLSFKKGQDRFADSNLSSIRDSLHLLRTHMPTTFDARTEPSTQTSPFVSVASILQWKSFEEQTSKMVRLLWATDSDGALRKLLRLSPLLCRPFLASFGRFLSTDVMRSKLPRDEKLLGMIVTVREVAAITDVNKLPLHVIDALCLAFFGHSAAEHFHA
jgi:PAS domain S-box-containing protein